MTTLAPPEPTSGERPLGAAMRAALEPLLAEAAISSRRALVSATLPVAEADPVALFGAARALGDDPFLWLQPARRTGLLGMGAAWSVGASGATRFAEVEAAWSALLAGAVLREGRVAFGTGPLLVGGFGFADAAASSPLWRGFASASFVLPELLLTITPAGSWLTASAVAGAGASGEDVMGTLLSSWRAVVAGADSSPTRRAARDVLRPVALRPDLEDWRDSVARLAGAVGRGRLDKAVLARQVDLLAPSDIDVACVLRRLRVSAPESTVFAVCRGERTFLGASPERLVRLRGREFRSVAMAGSFGRAPDAPTDELLEAELLASDKEREEHAVVVDVLRETLAPLAGRLDMPAAPSVLRLRHVRHLMTPVRGLLREPVGVLRLVERLHPTPAVGGAPRELALELIAEEERQERGWYAGPVGWVDRAGDGEFVVALRSGLVEGRAATLLAGCGIVADSDPDAEWAESEAKLLALGSALGRVQPAVQAARPRLGRLAW